MGGGVFGRGEKAKAEAKAKADLGCAGSVFGVSLRGVKPGALVCMAEEKDPAPASSCWIVSADMLEFSASPTATASPAVSS